MSDKADDLILRRQVSLHLGTEGSRRLESYAARREREGFAAGLLAAALIAMVVIGSWPAIREGLLQMWQGVGW